MPNDAAHFGAVIFEVLARDLTGTLEHEIFSSAVQTKLGRP